MKKRVKLFSTIASLCLAVALMAFGVLAATTETFKVTSTVSYSVTGQVNAEFKVSVQYSKTGITAPEIKTGEGQNTIGAKDSTPESGLITRTYNTLTIKPGETSKEQSLSLGEFKFNENATNNTTKIIYTVTISNKSNEALAVTLNAGEVAAVLTGPVSVGITGSTFTSNKVTTSETANDVTYIVTYTLIDGSTTLSNALEFNPQFTLAVKKAS